MRVTSFLSLQLWRASPKAGAVVFFGILSAAAIARTAPETAVPATVFGPARVVDGDTLAIGSVRIRLEGIDAPEMAQTCRTAAGQSWNCGKEAAAFLRQLVGRNDVACNRTGEDRYRRMLAICYANGVNLNAAMIDAGLARAFVRYSKMFVAAEADAKARGIGIWQGPAEAPWDFRHHEWRTAATTAPKGCAIKGNVSARGRLYHMPWSPWYSSVKIDERRGERWFCSEADAVAAGWHPASPD
jgi:endonuclease YncB( thermonuclease family)